MNIGYKDDTLTITFDADKLKKGWCPLCKVRISKPKSIWCSICYYDHDKQIKYLVKAMGMKESELTPFHREVLHNAKWSHDR